MNVQPGSDSVPKTWRVLVIAESDPASARAGKQARWAHCRQWLTDEGADFEIDFLMDSPDVSMTTRVAMAMRSRGRLAARAAGFEAVLVLGLGAPHMLLVASYLSKRSAVVFDACDSWLLQMRARLRGQPTRLIVPLIGTVVHIFARHDMSVTYISARDCRTDRILNIRRRTGVVYSRAPGELQALPDVRYPLERLVVPVDLLSFHNLDGFGNLLEALRMMLPSERPRTEVFGPYSPSDGTDVAAYMGWVRDLADLYVGDTAVFVTNSAGSGVPNKLSEALEARRPVIVHRSVAKSLELEHVWVYDNASDLAITLKKMQTNPIGGFSAAYDKRPTSLGSLVRRPAPPIDSV